MKWIKNFFGIILSGIAIILTGVSFTILAATLGKLIIIASPILALIFCYYILCDTDETEDNTDEG